MQRRKFLFVLTLTALMIVGFLATSLTSYFVARDSLSRNISEQMLPLTSDNIYSEIQRDLLRPILISSLMASDTFVQDWSSSGEVDAERIRLYLREIQQEYGTITAFFVSDRTHSYYHPDGIIKTVDADNPDDAWYFRVRDMREPYEINVDTDTADRTRLSIFINYRVLDSDGNYLGVTGVGLSVSAVTRLIDSYQERYGRQIYFVDREGRVALNQASNAVAQRLQERPGMEVIATQILTTPSASLSYVRSDGQTVYVNSRLVPEFNWYLMVEENDGAAEERIETTLLINIALSLAIMALVLLIAHFTLKSYQGRLEQMATTDSLTGAANRHVFDTIFDQVLRSARRRNKQVALISIDIDHFKDVNDTFGHQAGDLVIRFVADVIRTHSREADTLCRWGGEEFLLLLGDCTSDEAAERAEVIRKAVKKQSVNFGREDIRVTLSCGVAQYRSGEELFTLIARVDSALYRAKNEGRDRVIVAA
ncbi:MAG: diguanylate cyclase [Gammaproteobacteria bacterium]|nr:diguanylate cyclase [Gammaproteobacteria bacterium]